jgi:protein O-mannosyl-transferase
VLLLGPFFALAGAFYLLYLRVAAKAAVIDQPYAAFTVSGLTAKVATALQIPFFYLAKLLLPVGLSAEYDTRFAETLTAPAVLLAALGLVLAAGGAFAVRRRFPELLIGLAWFGCALIPVLNFFATNPVVADRYAFLPIFGIALLAGAGLARLTGARPRITVGISLVLVALWGGLSLARSGDWRSDRTLWSANIASAPKQAKGYVNLANSFYIDRAYEQALAVLAKGERFTPLGAYQGYFQGLVAQERGDLVGATAALKQAVAFDEDYIEALYRLAAIYEEQGNEEQATEYYAKVMMAQRQDTQGLVPKARAKRQQLYQKLAPRFASLQQRLATVPGDLQTRGQLALQLDRLGFYEEALDHYRQMEAGGYRQWPLYYNLGNTYLNLKRPREAADSFEKCLAANPGYGEALNGLGIALKMSGRYPEAVSAFDQAWQLDQDYAPALFNLAKTYFLMGNRTKASQAFQTVTTRFPSLADRAAPYRQLLRD